MKIVVPNVTVGMIIGRGGCYIKQIKDDTGAYIQISQKSHDTLLVERVITIGGTTEQMMNAFDMVLKMIIEDPQSSSCPNLSYSDFKGPIANAYPTGSPFASPGAAGAVGHGFDMPNSFGFVPVSGFNNSSFGGASSAMETLKTTLRGSGFSNQASEEITAAIYTLVNYGILNPSGFGFPGFSMGPGQCGVTLEALMGVVASGRSGFGGGGDLGHKGGDKKGVGGFGNGMESIMGNYGMYGSGAMNPFGFGVGAGIGASITGSDDGPTTSSEIQISENIVGAVLGHGGRAIIEIQRMTGASIKISKKGVFAPGTRNRIATISGNAPAVERAIFMVNQYIQQEEGKRVRQDQMIK